MKVDLAAIGDKAGALDPRFVVEHPSLDGDDKRLRLFPRVSDGQLLFLVNKLRKMKDTALFTGEAGSGKSNVRRWIIENDWLEATVALPLNIFHNTGIAMTSPTSSTTASPTWSPTIDRSPMARGIALGSAAALSGAHVGSHGSAERLDGPARSITATG